MTQKIIRMSVIGLSSAAAVALIIAIYITVPRNLQNNSNTEALVTMPAMNPELHSNENNTALIQSSGNTHNEVVKKSENKFIAR